MTQPHSDMDQVNPEQLNTTPVTWLKHLIVSVIILFIAFSVVGAMFASKPEARKFGNRPPPSVGVETTKMQPTDYKVWVDSYGVAEPLTQTQLVSDVNARVISVSPQIRAGASFQKGDVLIQLDPRDFEIEVKVAESAVADADFNYKQEVAQAALAEKDWNIRPGNPEARSLALREPQVAAALAGLKAAEARLARAKLNLERTEIRAPFTGKVLRQMVDLGQVVSPSQAIAEIYATETIEVRLPVKAQDLDNLTIPPAESINDPTYLGDRPQVIVEAELGRNTFQWKGELVRSEGAFDTNTRMLYVVARINDPFIATQERPALRVGQFLRAKIEGKQLNDVFVIPRRAVSQDNSIAIAEEGMLRKRKIQPLWTDADTVVVAVKNDDNTISSDDTLILTPTANLVDGTRVKSLSEQPSKQGLAVAENKNAADAKAAKGTSTTGQSTASPSAN
ncbi:efflux RND transporter periplasmic adaptor subunit [Aliikangiella marina]|uniref:Efflux RND transporter periplasmic adaptor subunit n=1 Tax=Aliikangiella marina TaxID=1712262 RepID=A0A545TE46_9GAMM|nr:efflux RND transporter periplasmic adaptor subunit [Aliikangiella marina]TQV75494.1 efflux RND transporter periplasmic adaptor subunit [Aliikangiella marina]